MEWVEGGASLEHLEQLDDVGVGGQPPQRLDLAQVVHLEQTPGNVSHRMSSTGRVT